MVDKDSFHFPGEDVGEDAKKRLEDSRLRRLVEKNCHEALAPSTAADLGRMPILGHGEMFALHVLVERKCEVKESNNVMQALRNNGLCLWYPQGAHLHKGKWGITPYGEHVYRELVLSRAINTEAFATQGVTEILDAISPTGYVKAYQDPPAPRPEPAHKQFSFYADKDVRDYLNSCENKTRILNSAVRQWMQHDKEKPSLEKRIARLEELVHDNRTDF